MPEEQNRSEREQQLARGRAEASIRQAQEDLSDIRSLRESGAFERYHCRRIRSKIEVLEKQILTGAGITSYEAYQGKLVAARELRLVLTMLDDDWNAASKELHPPERE